jgi:hypothetical protein
MPIVFYQQAIAKLEHYRENEPDQARRAEATRKICAYRIAIQDAAFIEISQRAARLVALQTDLQATIDSAGNDPRLSTIVADLTDFVGRIAAEIGRIDRTPT